ncbi:MAG: hypothetical protein ACREO4_16380 [Lysobacter sp.]
MSLVKVAVDPERVFERALTQLERDQLPFAAVQAANQTAFAVREEWKGLMPRVFDRPTSLTVNSVLYRKATKQKPAAEVFIRDEAPKGTPPAKYLLPEVQGGTRRPKAFERRLQAAGVLPSGMFAVAGKGAKLDAHGNVPGSVITAVLSAMRSQFDPYQNATETSIKRRRARRRKRGGDYFAIKQTRGKLKPGIYERVGFAFGSAVRSVLFFVRSVSYRPRYDVFGQAQRIYTTQFPFHFARELAKAVQTAGFRGRK